MKVTLYKQQGDEVEVQEAHEKMSFDQAARDLAVYLNACVPYSTTLPLLREVADGLDMDHDRFFSVFWRAMSNVSGEYDEG